MSAACETVIWHDVECGRYEADLPLWRELAFAADGPLMEIGAGTGRIALDLARRGQPVVAVEVEPELAAELRARARGLPIDVVCADITKHAPPGPFALVLAPMQVIQVVGGERARLAMLRHARGALAPGGRVAVAFVDTVADMQFGPSELVHEETLVRDEARYTSRAVSVRFSRRAIQIVRERRAQEGGTSDVRRSRSHESLQVLPRPQVVAEAARAGLEVTRICAVPRSDHDLACTAVVFAASGAPPR